MVQETDQVIESCLLHFKEKGNFSHGGTGDRREALVQE
jgi:hypothetical protein